MRDALAHRGPDGAGIWREGGVALAQRRLEVIAPGRPGDQPMASADGRWRIVYNGELYNDAALRRTLAGEGFHPSSACDTATVCEVLAAWGPGGLARCRGMFALAAYDRVERRVVLARDPLGVKPLLYTLARVEGGRELVAASEPAGLFAHPALSPTIDPLGLSAYLTTIRTSVEGRTLFASVRMLRPGEVASFDLRDPMLPADCWDLPIDAADACGQHPPDAHDAPCARTAAVVRDSVAAHLRADVPVCSLLSGGLDSAIVALAARERAGTIACFVAGEDRHDPTADPAMAAALAGAWGVGLTTIGLNEDHFVDGVLTLTERTGQPLGTPNEAAIHALGCAIRAAGYRVVLTGEGADELFGGYHQPLVEAAAHAAAGNADPGLHHLLSASWVTPDAVPVVLAPELARAVEGDTWLLDAYREAFAAEADRSPGGPGQDDPLGLHMRFMRRINLTGLLQRLDSALSQSGVEGRVPFADRVVAHHADALPVAQRFDPALGPVGGTKIALRRAFGGDLPQWVVERPKASFPLPFDRWLPALFARVEADPACRQIAGELVSESAWAFVRDDPAARWKLGWPIVNAVLWARRWFG